MAAIITTFFNNQQNSDEFIFSQGSAASVWTIIHNLNSHPAITIVDSAGTVIEGAEQYIDSNTVQVTFTAAFSGKAYLIR